MPATARVKNDLIVIPDTPATPQMVGKMLKCLTCGDITDGTDLAFSEVPLLDEEYVAHGNWMERNGKWSHLCDHYAVTPQPTINVDLWK